MDAQERRTALLLFGMMLVMGVLETVGVASVLPFIAVVSTPRIIHDNAYLNALFSRLGFASTDAFLLFLGAAVFVLIVSSLAFKALTEWATARYVHMRSYTLSCRLLRTYLDRPYTFFLNRHSADLGKSVLAEVQHVVNGALMPAMEVFANVIVATLLFALVVHVGGGMAVGAVAVLGGSYVLIYMFVREYLRRIGGERVRANRERYRIAQEALGGIKDLKVLGLEAGYVKTFQGPALRFARSLASSQVVAQMPLYVLQALAFGGLLVILLILLSLEGRGINDVLPVLALYAFAGIRLLPALQKVYQAATKLRYSGPVVETLYADLVATSSQATSGLEVNQLPVVRLREELKLDRVTYRYPQSESSALSDLTLVVRARTTVGLVGATGAGKTTVVDVILGLLTPSQGALLVDGAAITGESTRSWQRNIGYVPQQIFLIDDTVAANIAFGVPDAKIDMKAVMHAARIAELHEFVASELLDGYQTLVGERGVRLSGGQRQRIGIARALYHDPDVLVFDEATSALDNLTEKAVLDAVHNMAHRKTIILIAHRLRTVQACDTVFMLDRGQIKAYGTYEELLATSRDFRELANA